MLIRTKPSARAGLEACTRTLSGPKEIVLTVVAPVVMLCTPPAGPAPSETMRFEGRLTLVDGPLEETVVGALATTGAVGMLTCGGDELTTVGAVEGELTG